MAIEYRWAHGENGRLPTWPLIYISRPVSVIATPGSVAAAVAAKAATTTIPIVFMIEVDPVQAGLVVSLNRPGGNVTGTTSLNAGLMAKQLGLLHQLLHRDARFAFLVNPNNPQSRSVVTDVQATASAMGQQLEILTATTNRDIQASVRRRGEKTNRRAVDPGGPVVREPSGAIGHAGGTSRNAGNLYASRICRGRRAYELRIEPYGLVSPNWNLWAAFSRARSQPTYQSNRRPNSSSLLICRRLMRSALKFHQPARGADEVIE